MKKFNPKKYFCLSLLLFLAYLSLGILSPKAHANPAVWDADCAAIAADPSDPGMIGWAGFLSSVTVPTTGTATVTYRTYVCNGTDDWMDKDVSMTSGNGYVVETGQSGAFDYSLTGWAFDGTFWQQDMGSFAPHSWRSKDVTFIVDGSKFAGPGVYNIQVQGKARIWNASAGCFYPAGCWGETNTITVTLRLTVYRPVECTPLNQNVTVGTPASIGALFGDGSYSWSAPGGVPAVGVGNPFSVTYGSVGAKTVTVTSSSTSASCTVNVTPPPRLPYTRTYGGDVVAGADIDGGACSPNPSAQILARNKGFFGSYAGAGTQLAAQASAGINQFSSAAMRFGGSPPSVPPRGLTFANTTPTWGGNFGTGPCLDDYWADAAGIVPSYTVPAAGKTVPVGAKEVVYVNGNATILGNVIYSSSGTWSSKANVPSFYLVVKGGNIYIDRFVNQVDGVFIAIPDGGTGGRIYTCSNGPIQFPSFLLDTNCQNKLTVNGAFIAQQVRFLRTTSTVDFSIPNEPRGFIHIAEEFEYSPEVWLPGTDATGPIGNKYDSITSLPPIL